MRTLYLLVVINIGFIVSGCSVPQSPSSPITSTALMSPTHKNPIDVALYPAKHAPERPYKVIGKASVSRYNGSIKRQEATVQDLLRQQAAALNGDAIIDIDDAPSAPTRNAKVIAYKKILI